MDGLAGPGRFATAGDPPASPDERLPGKTSRASSRFYAISFPSVAAGHNQVRAARDARSADLWPAGLALVGAL